MVVKFGTKQQVANLSSLCPPPFPINSYYLIRYEDLVSDPLKHMRSMYAFMGVAFGSAEEERMLNHTQAGIDKVKTNQYYSTFRSKGFNPDKWRTDLPLEDIRRVEEQCRVAMKELNYTKFNPPEEGDLKEEQR